MDREGCEWKRRAVNDEDGYYIYAIATLNVRYGFLTQVSAFHENRWN
jgi:hypothetical protein